LFLSTRRETDTILAHKKRRSTMTFARFTRIAFLVSAAVLLIAFVTGSGGHPTVAAQPRSESGERHCIHVGGMLMTNVGAIEGVTNLGPVSGDLQGSIAATIKGQDAQGNFLVQHYWVTSAGDTILLKQAVLKPVATSDPNVVAVLWGNYSSDILGGTGKFKNATGRIEYFGIADFREKTLVLRYRGEVCFADQD
jgi:hypothetical protein